MKRRSVLLVSIACLLLLGGCASTQKASPQPPPTPQAVTTPLPASPPESVSSLPSGVVAEGEAMLTATVEKLDLASRLVTLKGPEGKMVTLVVGPGVKNLPQVKVGDLVVVGYYESVAYEVKRPGQTSPAMAVSDASATARQGEKPAGIREQVVTITTKIEAIDKKTPSVTLKDPAGELTVVKVKDPKKLESVKVGDLVEITYTRAIAVSVEKPPAK